MTWVEVLYCNVMENDDLRIFFIEVPVLSQESERSCIRLLGISTLNLCSAIWFEKLH